MKRKKYRIGTALLALATGAVMLASAVFFAPSTAEAADVQFYVSPTGNDATGDGSSGNPYKTLSKVRDRVRQTIAGGMSGNVIVNLKSGVYTNPTAFQLNKEDSGRNGYKVIYRNAPGETPIVETGTYVTGWQAVSGKPYYKKTGITFGNMSDTRSQTMFEDNTYAWKARYPNIGGTAPNFRNNYLKAVARGDWWYEWGFNASDNIPAIASVSNLEAYSWPGGSSGNIAWETNLEKVTAIDYTNRKITVSGKQKYEMGTNSRYYLAGAIELLDQPGEFYYDNANQTLYYYPRNTANLENGKIFIPYYEEGNDMPIMVKGGGSTADYAKDIVIQGLTVRNSSFHKNSDGLGAITVQNASNVEIRGNLIQNAGTHGLGICERSDHITFINNKVENALAGGIKTTEWHWVSGKNSYVTIEGNHFKNIGLLIGDSAGFEPGNGSENFVIRYNKFETMPRFGIYTKGELQFNQTIEYNEFMDAMYDSQDGAPIYFYMTAGTNYQVNNNYIHDINFTNGYDGFGIYMDDGASNYTVKNNIITRMGLSGNGYVGNIFTVKGIANVVQNNIAANNNVRNENGLIASIAMAGQDNRDINFQKNIFYNNKTNFYHALINWQDNRYAVADYNVVYNPNNVTTVGGYDYGPYATMGFNMPNQSWDQVHDWGYYTLATWKTLLNNKFDNNSKFADPKLMNPSQSDFRPQYDSVAYQVGFQDFNMRDMGLRSDFPFANGNENIGRLFLGKAGNTVDRSWENVTVGGTVALSLAGRTTSGYVANLSNATVTYSSSNTSVATVNASGVVTGVSAGVAKITATVVKNGVTSTVGFHAVVGGSQPSGGTVTNGGFETGNASGWTASGTSYGVDGNDVHGGSYKLYFWNGSAYTQSVSQTITGLTNGTYTVRAWVKQNTGTPTTAEMRVKSFGGTDQAVSVKGLAAYTQKSITVNVTNGQLTVEFYAQSPGSTNLQVDDVELIKVPPVTNPGFETGNTSGWTASGTSYGVDGNDVRSGSYKLYFWNGSAYTQSVSQTITGLTNGSYTVRAWIKQNTGTPTTAEMRVKSFGGTDQAVNVKGLAAYTQKAITVNVTNGQLTVEFYAQSPGSTNLQVDDVELIKN